MSQWTDAQIKKAQQILSCYPKSRFQEALRAIGKATKREVTADSLRGAFTRQGLGAPSNYCQDEKDEKATPTKLAPELDLLVKATKQGPISFSKLCDKLGLPPSKTKAVLDQAKRNGISVHVEHDHVGIKPTASDKRIQTIGIAPVVGERQTIAVISDTHLGSKYCLREQLREFIQQAYDRGIRDILHPGDVLEGMYRHAIYEVTHVGLDAQAQDLLETLPQLPGLNYHCITGNHDFTFTDHSGVDVGHFLTNYFRQHGRNDLHFYGNRGAFLKVKGAVIHLWHPKQGAGYARSYALQKQVEKYSSLKPQILLTGHWHTFCYVYERAVHAIACPTFQGGESAYGKSLGGSPAIGGLILSWDLTAHGTIRGFVVEKRSYFERERPVDLMNDLDATPVK